MGTIRTISFNEALHKYTDEENKVYTSVTTVIGKYHEEFDKKGWALKKSLDLSVFNPYRGMSPAAIEKQWEEGADFACDRGNKTHKLLEDSINEANGQADLDFTKSGYKGTGLKGYIKITQTNLQILADTPLAKRFPKIYNFLAQYINEGWTLYAEKRVYWFEFLIAGTIDCLLVKGLQFRIVDWKTNNKKLEFRSGYYKKFNGVVTSEWVNKPEFFYFPLNRIPFCKGHIYTLQLSLYAYLMELWGYECVGLTLFHILDEVPQDPITIAYWRQYCENLCKHFSEASSSLNRTNKDINKGTSFGIF